MPLVLDTECYKNYFLATFYNPATNKYFETELHKKSHLNIDKILHLMEDKKIITFNGRKYDIPMIYLACSGASNKILKIASDMIIVQQKMWWEIAEHFDFKIPYDINHIDIMNVIPGKASLKMYGARIHYPRLQELPFDPSALIKPKERVIMRGYCRNDTRVTHALYEEISEQMALRVTLSRQYNIDLRSKSDAQIAEAVITDEYITLTGRAIPKPKPKSAYRFRAPFFISFEADHLKELLKDLQTAKFKIKRPEGSVIIPNELLKKKINKKGETVYKGGREVTIGSTVYKLGIGGLHAKNKKESHKTNDEYQVLVIDATSYYPKIMLNAQFYPPQMGKVFLQIYDTLVTRRIKAKKEGDKVTADTLKIVINSGYGKLSERYSAFYAPDRLFHVTLTGQLSLLMLIEQIEMNGIRVISANTDGLEIYVKHTDIKLLRIIVSYWEINTGFVMEYVKYDEIYYRDVNNYIAITEDWEMKAKGIFNMNALDKNPVSNVCIKAVIDKVMYDKPIEESILQCNSVTDFLTVRTVKGGGQKDGNYIGKVVRWYYSLATDTAINYISNGNQVATSQGAMPMMNLLDEVPDDLDYDYYIGAANKMLKLIGATT